MSKVVDISYRQNEVVADKIKAAWDAFDAALTGAGLSLEGIQREILREAVFRMWKSEDRATFRRLLLAEVSSQVDELFDSIGD